MSQRFAQLSDPHLSSLEGVQASQLLNKRALGYLSWKRKRRFEHRREVLDALQRHLDMASLDQLLVTGDLTHIGLPQEFEQGRDWLRGLGSPQQVALVPGNHDACVSAPWDETFALWQDYMAADDGAGDSFPTLRVRGDIAFIGVSTGCPKPPLMATGTAGPAQREKLATLLQQTRERGLCRVLYLHHCPMAGFEKWRKRLTDAPQLQSLLEEHGVELVVHGHGHRAHFNELQTRDGTAPVIGVPSASALGLHGADVASYNQYEIEKNTTGWLLSVTPQHYERDSGDFAEGKSQQFNLARG